MRRNEMVMVILRALGELDVMKPNGYDYKEQAEHILDRIEKAGMKPPCVSSDDFQTLMHLYVEPMFYQWDEDLEKDEKFQQVKKRRAKNARS